MKFPDGLGRKGQKNTPAADVKGIVEIIMLMPGQQAARVRRQAAELLVRYLGGGLGMIDEVIALRGLQKELATQAPVFFSRRSQASGKKAIGQGMRSGFSHRNCDSLVRTARG